jgi:hypothetical protein
MTTNSTNLQNDFMNRDSDCPLNIWNIKAELLRIVDSIDQSIDTSGIESLVKEFILNSKRLFRYHENKKTSGSTKWTCPSARIALKYIQGE